jgi:hypothetical protein
VPVVVILGRRLKDLNPFRGTDNRREYPHRDHHQVRATCSNTCRTNVLKLEVVVQVEPVWDRLTKTLLLDNLGVVAMFRQLSCQEVASCPVVAAQECREERTESGWVISKVHRRERCRCRPVVHRCLEGWGSLVVVGDVEVDSGNTTA